jgi:phytoene dehydrogenase-like protein
MTKTYDVIVIGGGHNGLTAAAYLAKAGRKVLVVERRPVLGGAATTEEVVPGFKFDACAHSGELRAEVVRDLDLARHGLKTLDRAGGVFAPLPEGDPLRLEADPARAAEALRRFSPRDAERWPAFTAQMGRLAGFLQTVQATTIPKITSNAPADLFTLAGLGLGLRRLGDKDMIEALRALPMSVAELLDDWFETDALKGAVGAAGITGIFEGPRASGTAYVLLHHLAGTNGHLRAGRTAQGGIGGLAAALAASARAHGAEIRTGAEVARVLVKDGRATGVVLAGGEEIAARQVASNADPGRTFLGLVGPENLEPEFVRAVGNIRYRGACAKVNLALAELPKFRGLNGDTSTALRGTISISPSLNYLEHAYDDAKYGAPSRRPYLEAVIPSLADPSLAPPGQHVMSVLVQYAPYRLKEGTWDERRESFGDAVIEALAEYAPNLKGAVLGRQVLTPADLEATYGLTGGNINHGELALDQLFFMRPVAGWAQYRTPIHGLYLCGAGAHPGGGLSGLPGRNAAREMLKDKA